MCFASFFARAQCIQTTDVTSSLQYPPIPPVYNSRLVFDQARGVTLALDEEFGDLFRYDGVAWSDILPPPHQDLPPSSAGGAWVYDAAHALSLFLPGYDPSTFQPNTGLYSQDTQGWKALTWAGASPPPSYGALGAFDPSRGRVIFLLQADASSPNTWQTWEWTGSNWDAGPLLGNVQPGSFTFDSARGLGFLSGLDPASSLEAVWLYTPAATANGTWSRATISGTPYNGIVGATLAYDPTRDRIIRCLGKYEASPYAYLPQIEVWDWAQSTWIRTNNSYYLPEADARAGAGVAYDLNRDLLVIYGGITVAVVGGTATTTYWHDTWEQKVRDVLYVNGGNAGVQDGSAAHPYATVRQAASAVTGCIRAIAIQTGNYSESPLSLSAHVLLKALNGPVTIH